MNLTINQVIGIFVGITAFGIALYWVPQTMFTSQEPDAITSASMWDPPFLIITWETEEPHMGYVYYKDTGWIDDRDRESELTKTHRVKINTTNTAGTVTYHVESCPLRGECIVEAERTYP